jgi:hypothetical protein
MIMANTYQTKRGHSEHPWEICLNSGRPAGLQPTAHNMFFISIQFNVCASSGPKTYNPKVLLALSK